MEGVREVVALGVSHRMRRLLPQILWTGISLAVLTSLLVPIIVDTLPGETT
jgi:hypothetical protein